jgi:hypothetical protein
MLFERIFHMAAALLSVRARVAELEALVDEGEVGDDHPTE